MVVCFSVVVPVLEHAAPRPIEIVVYLIPHLHDAVLQSPKSEPPPQSGYRLATHQAVKLVEDCDRIELVSVSSIGGGRMWLSSRATDMKPFPTTAVSFHGFPIQA
jgi:hypothetical protein